MCIQPFCVDDLARAMTKISCRGGKNKEPDMENKKPDPNELRDISYFHQILATRKVIDREYIESYKLDYNSGLFTKKEIRDYTLRLMQTVKEVLNDNLPELPKSFIDKKINELGHVANIAFLPRRTDDFEYLQRESKIQILLEQQYRLSYHDHLQALEYEPFLESLRTEYSRCSDLALTKEFQQNQRDLAKMEIMSDNRDYRTLSEEIGITLHNTLGVFVASNG